ncbi:hypothetical protein Zm00014a_036153 [Zea mays]|uniref:Putative RNA-binding protein 46 n=1 Tax=Zea mays TaxID=4577 RepID=A0A3L6FTU0_MAIZE|nr:hypothetical protein Zm00014a_036153 [Zea mays]PWZ38185.1 hypothetical protein Zm00014a_036153 [Zea mays]PWZ38186.1 hypothetical protein Zm00014a_036153 [Zea mays]PWZ38187.1 putative RNA-binding protein 46 [Zea mays]PWZ38188.1 hypothetical protein Zm00014a_036153 [Zea mays]
MPRRTGNAAPTKSVELVKQDQLEFDDPDEVDEEEEVEYEEIEEEVEYEEVEEEEEEEDDEDEEDEEMEGVHEIDANDESKMVDADGKVENEKEKHAELLALPPHGAEVYVGGISSDVSSEDLKQLFESVGEVVEVRMRGKGDNRTYAFINFRTKAMALKAIQNLSNKDLKGKKIKVSPSQAKNRLFIGNVPHDWTHDDFKTAVEEVGPGVLKVELMKAPGLDRNKGYGFIEYYNQACAEYAKQKMSTPEFKLDTNAPTVSWADPKNANEATSTAQVSCWIVHLRNLLLIRRIVLYQHLLQKEARYSQVMPHLDMDWWELIIHVERDWQMLIITPLEMDWQVLMVCFPLVLPRPQAAGQQPVHATSPLPQQGGRRFGGSGSGGGGSSSSGGKRQRGDDRGSNSNNSRRGRHRPY